MTFKIFYCEVTMKTNNMNSRGEGDFQYFDSRLSGRRGQERKPVENDQIITFSPMTGRIYFSTGAVHFFGLGVNRVTFVQRKNRPKDLFLYIDNKHGFKLINYRWAEYVNSKKAVEQILDLFMGEIHLDEPVKFKVITKGEKVDGHKMFRLVIQNDGTSQTGTSGHGKAPDVITQYRSEDFKGRIKTQEIIRAEQQMQHFVNH